MSMSRRLIDSVIAAGKARGLDQARLAAAAGLRAESLSRAKKRGTIELDSLQRLAAVTGLELRLVEEASAAAMPRDGTPNRSTLAHPKWGLAWSNPNITDEALVRAALKHGGFQLVLEAVSEFGLPFVTKQYEVLAPDLTARARNEAKRQLNNIEIGLERAQA